MAKNEKSTGVEYVQIYLPNASAAITFAARIMNQPWLKFA